MRNSLYKYLPLFLLCTIGFITTSSISQAQNKQSNIWYFGSYAGLDFNTSPPTTLNDGALNTWEGCASIADKNGQLLFYTDGITIWNKEHSIMQNGGDLTGDPSSTQSGVIVPYPGREELYYVFTVSNYGVSLDYSILDMTKDSGKGVVIEKNINMLKDGTEKIAATLHGNGKDIWLLSHKWKSDEFILWQITEEGISNTPLVQSVGSEHWGEVYTGLYNDSGNTIGYLKFSTSSSKVAVAAFGYLNFVEVFDFDSFTGQLIYKSKMTDFGGDFVEGTYGAYAVEFSPNEQFLYIGERNGIGQTSIYQVDLDNANGKIDSVGFRLDKMTRFVGGFGSIQLAPNGKIYIARDDGRKFLAVVNNPDQPRELSNYNRDGIEFGRHRGAFGYTRSRLGLPNMVQSFYSPVNFSAEKFCGIDSTLFQVLEKHIDNIDSLTWNFDNESTSHDLNPAYLFHTSGLKRVNLKVFKGGELSEITKSIFINAVENNIHTESSIIKESESITIEGQIEGQTYLWNDGTTDTTKTITTAGWHWLEATNEAGCVKRDSMAVFKLDYSDTCQANPTRFEIDTGNVAVDSIRWNFNDPQDGAPGGNLDQTHVFQQAGEYSVQIDLYYNGESLTEQFDIEIAALPAVALGSDQTLFYGESLDLDVSSAGESYLWQDGSTSGQYTVTQPGIYWVEVQNANGCINRDSIQINYDQVIDVSLPADTTLCLGESISLDVSLPEATYEWQDGSTSAEYTVTEAGIYWVKITNAYQNRVKTDSVIVDYYEFNELSTDVEIVICETSNALLRATGARDTETYRWYDDDMNLLEENSGDFTTSELRQSVDFFVTLTNGICESPALRISVIYDQVFAEIIASDTIVKLGDSIELFGLGGEAYEWSPADWLNTANSQNVISSPLDDITYTLTVSSMRGCTATAGISILVEKQIEITNVFSPNGDGLNDFWEIRFIDRFPNNKVQIFDRGGILIHEAKDYKNDWNGTYNGNLLPEGAYFYKIDLNDRAYPIQKGSITILRND